MDQNTEINESVLLSCQEMLRKFLDIDRITPALENHDMLTRSDREVLSKQSSSLTRVGKIDYFLSILPSKGLNWFEKFITALTESDKGTGSAHTDLVRALRRLQRAKRGQIDSLAQGDYDQSQPSRIASVTGFIAKKSNLHHLQAARPHSASSASPSVNDVFVKYASATRLIQQIVEDTQKKIVEDTQRQQLVLKNQIRLVSLNKSLIQHIKMFQDALMNVQSFYVERFRNYAANKQLSGKQLKMAKLIESLTGCDENFDVVKETEEWIESLKLLEETYEDLEKVLFSLEDSQIEQQQLQFKLEGEAKEDASKWIADREGVVENGNACIKELVTLIDRNDTKESDLIDNVKKRIDAGKECLDLWKKWVDLRASL